MGEGGRRPGEGRATDVDVFHRREADERDTRILAARDGGDVDDGIRLGQRVEAGVVAKRGFVPQQLVGSTWPSMTKSALGKTVLYLGNIYFVNLETALSKRAHKSCGRCPLRIDFDLLAARTE